MATGKACGIDEVPTEFFRGEGPLQHALFALVRCIWKEEDVPEEMVRGLFVMVCYYAHVDMRVRDAYEAAISRAFSIGRGVEPMNHVASLTPPAGYSTTGLLGATVGPEAGCRRTTPLDQLI